jgi:outer membrane protein OmpA-like peptidoglycan-associated protein/6-phosphogluconolactonase (cycloisomerase 2 family)
MKLINCNSIAYKLFVKLYSKIFFVFVLILFAFNTSIFAQLEASNWVFGNGGGISFKSGSPVAFSGSKINTTEGCATISDKTGQILFYTDGITVWDRNNTPMPNGENLFGDPSSTQSGVAVPLPGNNSKYYLFTIDAEANKHGFCYSIIDMSLNNNKGDVIEKNTLLKTPSTEKITAVKHRNNKDYWILTHNFNSNSFLAYLLTDKGLNPVPVESKVGLKHGEDIEEIDNTIGYMKTSPDGSQLAVAIKGLHCFQVFDFDNKTGEVSNPITFQLEKGSLAYGVEFSPNGSLLYVGAGGKGKIYQVNLQAGNEESIKNSLQVIGESKNKRWIGALQIGIDGKIYVSEYTSEYLSVIEEPNKIGKDCSFKNDKVDLNGNSCQLGFPTFIQTYFIKEEITKEQKNVQIFSDKAKVEVNKRFILNNILFDFNKSTLRPSSFVELQKVVNILKNNPKFNIEISGHTDNIGNKSYNLSLSKDRADAVASYLISKGIDKNRIKTVGEGSTNPIATNSSEEGRQQNRRVEFMMK